MTHFDPGEITLNKPIALTIPTPFPVGPVNVYLLDGPSPEAAAVTITTMTARDSLLRLIEYSLAGAPVAALGWSAARLRRLSRFARRTPVRRLGYPAGAGGWRLVHQAIARDLAATSP